MSKTILRYIIGFIIMAGVPNMVFILLSITIKPLDPIIYVISTITAWCIICYSAYIKLISSDKNWKGKIVGTLVLMFILPLVGIIGIDFASPIAITTEHVAEAGFSYVFGACVATGFNLILPKKSKK